MRRARPLLGTIVDIQARARGKMTESALEAGFTAITKIQRLMSFHENESDVSRINREAWRGTVTVHPLTWRVLKAAQEFSRRSAGVFDITIAPSLVEWNYLPVLESPVNECARWRDIVLLSNGSVRFRRKLAIDLGGIAKGFAVDRAVEANPAQAVTPALSEKVPRSWDCATQPIRSIPPEQSLCASTPWPHQRATSAVSTETVDGCLR